MIFDDMWNMGARRFYEKDSRPMVVAVPIASAVQMYFGHGNHSRLVNDKARLLKLVPADEAGDILRMPYPKMAIVADENTGERGARAATLVFARTWEELSSEWSWKEEVESQPPLWGAEVLEVFEFEGRFSFPLIGAIGLWQGWGIGGKPIYCADIATDDDTWELVARREKALSRRFSLDAPPMPPEMLANHEWRRAYADMLTWAAYRFLAVCAFMNTKNIRVIRRDPPAKLQRATIRRNKEPKFSYHELVVGPLSDRRSQAVSGAGAPMPIHWVRGHFKTFDAERPLFGRVTGRFWWQPHIAGDLKAGAVEKDYRVKGMEAC